MFKTTTYPFSIPGAVFKLFFVLTLFVAVPSSGLAQTANGAKTEGSQQATIVEKASKKSETQKLIPVLKNYKGISIGSAADEVTDKLGKPLLGDKQGFFYRFSDSESTQIVLNKKKKVRVISMMYADSKGDAPKPVDIFGAEIQVAPMEDGSIYKMTRYPDSGYLVIYSRGTGDNPMVVVTMQKL